MTTTDKLQELQNLAEHWEKQANEKNAEIEETQKHFRECKHTLVLTKNALAQSNAELERVKFQCADLIAANEMANSELEKAHERSAQQLAACDCAAMMDTEETHKQAVVEKASPFWSPAYESVMRRTSECLKLRAELEKARAGFTECQTLLKEYAKPCREEWLNEAAFQDYKRRWEHATSHDCGSAMRARVAALESACKEVMQWHADKRSPEYNECDTEPCAWCSGVKDALSGTTENAMVKELRELRDEKRRLLEWLDNKLSSNLLSDVVPQFGYKEVLNFVKG